MHQIGYCITSHGYGHAARAAAVMESLSGRVEAHFSIISAVPDWFFRESLTASYSLYPLDVDVGLVQHSALQLNLPGTIEALEHFYAAEEKTRRAVSSLLTKCDLVISDIAPIAFSAARDAGIPSVLLENFTWDWIYEEYLRTVPEIGRYIERIREGYRQADYRIQAEPVCRKQENNLTVAPIARKKRNDCRTVRRRLGMSGGRRVVLISMGGEGIGNLPTGLLQKYPGIVFLLSGFGGSDPELENIQILRSDSGMFHPDLVASVDAVVGKLGYSTLAEVYHAQRPYGYIPRVDFRESPPLARFVEQHMDGIAIAPDDFMSGQWLGKLPGLFESDMKRREMVNGADQSADFILSLLQ